MSAAGLESAFSPAEQQRLLQRLYALAAVQAQKYLAGSGTSLPQETAAELLHSLVYTLRLALAADGRPDRALLTEDLDALLRQGQSLLAQRRAAALCLWGQACESAPPYQSGCLRDSLAGAGAFFRRWDLWYFAHQVPCRLDYPLCAPVPETLEGIGYMEAWLRRLLAENRLLRCLPASAVTGLLARCGLDDAADFPLNLCEQPAVNAIGLALLGRPCAGLTLSEADCAMLCRRFAGASPALLLPPLRAAARAAAVQLCAPPDAAACLCAAADTLAPRFCAALAAGDVRGVFAARPGAAGEACR